MRSRSLAINLLARTIYPVPWDQPLKRLTPWSTNTHVNEALRILQGAGYKICDSARKSLCKVVQPTAWTCGGTPYSQEQAVKIIETAMSKHLFLKL